MRCSRGSGVAVGARRECGFERGGGDVAWLISDVAHGCTRTADPSTLEGRGVARAKSGAATRVPVRSSFGAMREDCACRCVQRSWSAEGGRAGRAVTSTCLDMVWSGRGGEGILRVACFVGQAVLDEVHAQAVHARASEGSVPRRGRFTRGRSKGASRGGGGEHRGMVGSLADGVAARCAARLRVLARQRRHGGVDQ